MRAKHHEMGRLYLGRIQDGPIEDVVHTEKFKGTLERNIAAGVRKCEKSCAQFAFCGGGSPSNKYIENGTMDCDERPSIAGSIRNVARENGPAQSALVKNKE